MVAATQSDSVRTLTAVVSLPGGRSSRMEREGWSWKPARTRPAWQSWR